MKVSKSSRRALLVSACLSLAATPTFAQDEAPPEDDEALENTVIVTGARITQGGAQDVKHFRSIALDEFDEEGFPRASSFTVEGLLSEHDLILPSKGDCEQLFCVSTHAMPATRAESETFVGIGFESGIDADAYRAEPLSLIAVVDRSGSMNGAPIARVKEALHAIVGKMREGDRLGIVIYGSDTRVHQEVIDVAGNKPALHAAVDTIGINGSTYMEAGMKLGFATAFAELPNSRGKTRLMLFTDENPNVGDTSAEGFMGQAIDSSRKGVGMTTIGVGAHFDGALATKVSSVRGGNLFFVPREGAASELFETEFENMVGEVAQDLVISIDPTDGMKVGAIYGVPGDLITDAGSGTVTVTIGSAFLSSKGGGIYATLEGESSGAALAEISVAYTDAVSQKREADTDTVIVSSDGVPANLAKAELLVDQYVTTTAALARYHKKGDAKGASKLLAGLSERIEASGIAGLDGEIELVDGLAAKATKLAHLAGRTLPSDLYGNWKVVRHRGVEDISRGDLVEINEYGEFITERTRGREKGEEVYQEFAVNEHQLHIEDTGLVFDYRVRGDKLTLRNRIDGTEILMRRDTT